MIDRKPNLVIDPDEVIVEIESVDYARRTLRVNLVFLRMGEIRQKTMSFDEIGKRAFQSEIKTWAGTYEAMPMIPYREARG